MKNEQWAQWLEVVASGAIIVTLIILVIEVQTNTAAVERQAAYERALTVSTPFFEDPDLAESFVKILSVDGAVPMHESFIERYQLTPEQAIKWERHLLLFWNGVEADLQAFGRSDDLVAMVRGLVCIPDHKIFWDQGYTYFSVEFRNFIEEMRLENSC